jgi:hypothetical protein
MFIDDYALRLTILLIRGYYFVMTRMSGVNSQLQCPDMPRRSRDFAEGFGESSATSLKCA